MRVHVAATLLAIVVLLATGSAAAQSVPAAYPTKVFVTVDSVKLEVYRVTITGIVQGEATPSTFYVQGPSNSIADPNVFAQSCQQQALLAMAKPGQYLLTIYASTSPSCQLTRVTP
jgi:hypothetical protein